jgi:hypothetical protein
MLRRFSLVVAFLLVAGLAPAQTVYNPSRVEFTHSQHLNPCPTANGVTCIAKYVIEFWLPTVDPATGSPVQVSEIPKSVVTPVAGQAETYTALLAAISPVFAAPTGTTYVARLRAVDDIAQASERSAASNPFAYLGAPLTPAAVSLR